MNSRQLFDAGKLNAAIEALGSELRDNPTDTQRRTSSSCSALPVITRGLKNSSMF